MGEEERGLQEEERRQAPRKDSEERVEAGGSDAGESERAAVNTSHSNIKNLRTSDPGGWTSDDTR